MPSEISILTLNTLEIAFVFFFYFTFAWQQACLKHWGDPNQQWVCSAVYVLLEVKTIKISITYQSHTAKHTGKGSRTKWSIHKVLSPELPTAPCSCLASFSSLFCLSGPQAHCCVSFSEFSLHNLYTVNFQKEKKKKRKHSKNDCAQMLAQADNRHKAVQQCISIISV